MRIANWHLFVGLSLATSAMFALWRYSCARTLDAQLLEIGASGAPVFASQIQDESGDPSTSALAWYALAKAASNDAERVALARRAREFRPLGTGESLRATVKTAPALVPIDAARDVANSAQLATSEQRWFDASADASTLFDLARLHEDAHTMLGAMTWCVLRNQALDAALDLARNAPRDLEGSSLEALVADALEPREVVMRALEVERASVNDHMASVLSGGGSWPALLRLQHWIVGAHDQATALSAFAASIADAGVPAFERRPRVHHEPNRWTSPISSMLGGASFARCAQMDTLEARTLVARFALAARRAGESDARALLADEVDPFSGRPLSTRRNDDGTLDVWSIGQDRIDDDGDSEKDIRARVPLPR